MGTEKIICDTDVLIDYFDKNNSRNGSTTVLLERDIGLDNMIISSITKMDYCLGRQTSQIFMLSTKS